jgi:hypothetical protein
MDGLRILKGLARAFKAFIAPWGDAVEFLNERESAGDELRNTLKLHNSVNLKPATRGPHLHQTAPFPVTNGV